jgi:hypothetical protein
MLALLSQQREQAIIITRGPSDASKIAAEIGRLAKSEKLPKLAAHTALTNPAPDARRTRVRLASRASRRM